MKYLVKISPLEPYSFGTDQNFRYADEKSTGKESYFIHSKEMPEQTAVLGLLRYLVLQNQGLLKTNFEYSAEERKQMSQLIGAKSFSYLLTERQDFGTIHEMSPVFVVNEKNEVLVRNPFHNTEKKKGYAPMKMETGLETSAGTISLPIEGQYLAKEGYADGFINLSTKEIVKDLFATQVVTGNKKTEQVSERDDGFFKRELLMLKDGYSFAVFVEADMLPVKTIGYMGKKKSTFFVETNEVEDTDLERMVQHCFAEGEIWYYALSDLVLQESAVYEDFCIVQEKYQRNLETVYDERNGLRRFKKSEVRHHLIQSGSVFYKTMNIELRNENAKQIGYNRIVKLGGE